METTKAVWDSTAARIFCECAAEQVSIGNRPTKFLTQAGYKNLVADFNTKTGRNYSRSQLKNRWDDLKAIFSAWVFYKLKAIGLGWHDATQTITADDAQWAELIKIHKPIKAFRKGPPDNLELMYKMFENANVDGTTSMMPGVEEIAAIEVEEDLIDVDDEETEYATPSPLIKTRLKRPTSGIPSSPAKLKKNNLPKDFRRFVDPQFRDVHERLQDARFYPHFNNAIGAIDGTHIPVIVPAKDMINHVGRHGFATQNVMVVCDFDMRFISVVAGWPGSAHDTRIFKDTLDKYKQMFPHPPTDKYYLVDSGYPNQTGYLGPFKNTRYHIPEFRDGPAGVGRMELFNYLHSSLRNVIERCFAVLKQKWRMLKSIPSYSPRKQAMIIIACLALHNFIRDSAMYDYHFARCDANENYLPLGHVVNNGGGNYGGGADGTMDATRNSIADALMAA